MTTKSILKTHRSIPTIVFLFVLIVMSIPIVSADLTWDNIKHFDNEIGNYGMVTIKDWFGLKNQATLELKTNTDICSDDCKAENEIIMYGSGRLIDDIRFDYIKGDSKIDYTIKYKKEGGVWQDYNYEKVKPGTYELKIEGNLKPFQTVDWQIKSQGFWIEEWAIWTSDLNTRLTNYYDFNTGSGTILDEKVFHQENGTLINSPNWIVGLLGNALAFGATNKEVNISALTINNTEQTISVWLKPNQTFNAAGNERIMSGRGFEILRSGAEPSLQVTAGGVTVTKTDLNGSWWQPQTYIHLAIVLKSGATEIYFNGTRVNVSTVSFVPANPNSTVIGDFFGPDAGFDFSGAIDELGIWNTTLTSGQIKSLYNNGIGITFNPDAAEVNVNLNNLSNGTVIKDTTFNLSATYIAGTGVLSNATYNIWFKDNSTLFNQSTFDIPISINATNISFTGFFSEDYLWNVRACRDNATSTTCFFAPNNFTFTVGAVVNNYIFNTIAFETAIESFTANISTPTGFTPTNGKFIYNGTETTATIVNVVGDNYTISDSISISSSNLGNNNFSFKWDLGVLTQQSNETRQIVNQTLFNICNSTLNVPYINITFKNETLSLENVNASISSTWIFWLGDGSENKTITFVNATENPNYQFCFSPADRTMTTEYVIDYNNIRSQQRTFGATSILSNLITTKILYLLPTALGLFSPFQTIKTNGDPIALVKAVVTRTIGSTAITSVVDFTDDSGFLTMFLNPSVTYGATFSKTGFPDNVFSFVPTTDIRTVTMGGGAQQIANGSQISYNTTFRIEPVNSSLTNNTAFDFKFIVNSTQAINFISMNITNSSGFQLGFQSDTSTGILTQSINTGNQTKIIGRYVIKTSDETITVSKVWIIGDEFIGDYSIFKQFSLFIDYEFKDFIGLLIVMIVLMGILIYMSSNETLESSESKIAVILLLIWAFSLVGWLDTGLITNSDSSSINTLGKFSNQFGIAILSTVAGSFFILRRLFIRRI